VKPEQELTKVLMSSLLSGAAMVAIAQPVFAAAQVTAVQITPTAGGATLLLRTNGSDRPQVFSVNRGRTWTADLINTQIAMPGGRFQQANPAPGISLVTVAPIDRNSVRVTVTGSGSAIAGQVTRNQGALLFSMTAAPAKTTKAATGKKPTTTAAKPSNTSLRTAQAGSTLPPLPAPSFQAPLPKVQPLTVPAAQAPAFPTPLAQLPPASVTPPGQFNPPSVTPPGQFTPPATLPRQFPYQPIPGQSIALPPSAPIPLPRAVPPPVGDIAVGQVDSSPTSIDLGTNERVPRLVLRDASAREALSLLARSVGLNIAYAPPQPLGSGSLTITTLPILQVQDNGGPKITLDIENEPVQNVFNYILQVTGLEANRVGRTIFVSPRLPDTARSLITRTLRLNQVTALAASAYLSSVGASTLRSVDVVRIEEVGTGTNRRFVETRDTEIRPLEAKEGTAPLLLRGLSITTDNRLNAITLVGPVRKVEIATSLLTQLDARRRQVVVNVKIIDVNLAGTDSLSSSFSFGVGSNFFSVDQGAALFNFGRSRPPSNAEVAASPTSPPITRNLFPTVSPGFDSPALGPFVDAPQSNAPFGTNSLTPPGGGARAPFGTPGNPFLPGVTQFTPGSSTPILAPNGGIIGFQTTPDQVTFGLPSLLQFPTRFLARLQAQVVSGNAKILTDPSLTIQEGETSTVALTQDIVTRVTSTFTDTAGGSRQVVEPVIEAVGLILGINVERIDDNGFISVRVNPLISAPTNTTTVGGQTITLTSTRRVESGLVRLRDGQTLILSGIIQDSDRSTIRKIPILGDIPILGALFRSTERTNQRQEVIVMLTPRILDDTNSSGFGYGYTPSREVQKIIDAGQR